MGVIFLIHQYFPPTGAQIKLALRLVRINSSVKIYSGRNRPLLVFNLPMALAHRFTATQVDGVSFPPLEGTY
jgi:hypothetical protein